MTYIDHLEFKHYSVKTLGIYRRELNAFAAYLKSRKIDRVQDVTPEHLDGYRLFLFNRKLAPSTVDLSLRTVRGFFKHLTHIKGIFASPAEGLILPRINRRLQFVPSEDEVKRLLSMPDPATVKGCRDLALLQTAYSCALRLAELAGLTVEHLDIKQRLVKIRGKGAKERLAPLGLQASLTLTAYLDVRPEPKTGPLWLGVNTRQPLSLIRIQQIVKAYSRIAGIAAPPISIHALRRACVSHMLKNGAHPMVLKELLGHARIATLTPYLKVNAADLCHMQRESRTGR